MNLGKSASLAFVIIFAAIGVVSVAWACTVQPRVFSVFPETGAPATAVTLSGKAVPANSQLEVRWNSMDGQTVGTAVADENGQFSVPVIIPDVAPGSHYLLLEAGAGGIGRVALEVTSKEAAAVPAAQAVSASSWSPPKTPISPVAGGGAGLVVGVALMSAGLVGLFGGVAAAAVSTRRRAATRS